MKWHYSLHLFASLGELWLARGELAKAQDKEFDNLEGKRVRRTVSSNPEIHRRLRRRAKVTRFGRDLSIR